MCAFVVMGSGFFERIRLSREPGVESAFPAARRHDF